MFDNLTHEELLQKLRSMTANQLKVVCNGWVDQRTKRQLIILIMALKTLDIDTWQEVKSVIREGDARGQTFEVDEIQDVLGNKIETIRREFTYKGDDPKAPIHFIRTRHFDRNDKELIGQGMEIEHLGGGEVVSRPI